MTVNHVDNRSTSSFITDVDSVEVLNDKPVQRDQYGNLILPGYRPPFKKGYDPRRGRGPKIGFKFVTVAEASRLILKMERVIEELQAEKKSRKSLSKPRSATNHGVATRDSKPTPISPTITPRPVDQSAPQVKPEGINSAPIPKAEPIVSPKPVAQAAPETATPVDDDCPF